MKILNRRIQSCFPELIGLLTLVCSVSMLPTLQDEDDSSHGLMHQVRHTRTTSNRTTSGRASSTLLFPGETQAETNFLPRFGFEKPPCANGSTYCSRIDDYPSQYIENLLKNSGKAVQDVLTDDADGIPIITKQDDDAQSLCTSVQEFIYPQVAKNMKDEWLYVVNQGAYKQGIKIEKCRTGGENGAGGQCKFHQMFPEGYTTKCTQKHVIRKLVAVDKNGKPITDGFPLPSCCACEFKFN